MKHIYKLYIKPSTKIYSIDIQRCIALSATFDGDTNQTESIDTTDIIDWSGDFN